MSCKPNTWRLCRYFVVIVWYEVAMSVENTFMAGRANHWPKAIITVGVLLTLAWIGFLAWLLLHAVQ